MAERPEVRWLAYRWTDDPDAVPAPGEALLTMRADNIPTTTIPGAGPGGTDLVVSDNIPTTTFPGAGIGGTDLVVFTAEIVVDVRAADGRRMLVTHRAGDDAPRYSADAPPALRDAFERAWRKKAKAGRPPDDFAAVVALYREWIVDRTHAGADVSGRAMQLKGWNTVTVKRHVQRCGYEDLRAFRALIVAEHRSSCAECSARR